MEGRNMDELLAVLDFGQAIGISILIWRAFVSDRERSEFLRKDEKTQDWIKALVLELLIQQNAPSDERRN